MSTVDLGTAQTNILSALIEIYSAENTPVKGETIADRVDRNPGTIRNQMQSLKSLQLVEGVPGPKGGYKPTEKAYNTLDEPNFTPVDPDKIELLKALEDQAVELQNRVNEIETLRAEKESNKDTVKQPEIEIDILTEERSLFDVVQIESDSKILLSDPKSVRRLVERLDDSSLQNIDLQLDTTTIETVKDQFPLNSIINELISEEKINLYESMSDDQFQSVLLTEKNSYLSTSLFGVNVLFKIGEQNVTQKLRYEFDSTKKGGIELKIESWSSLISQLESATNPEAAREFKRLSRGNERKLATIDEVETALRSGARAQVLFSNISKWGEETNIGSKATFSRSKTELENEGEIETEKVPIDVGRPKLRLISTEVQ